jgi:hypothetical protein
MGYCAGNPMPGYANPDNPRSGRGMGFGYGRGFGRGMGRGRGWRCYGGYWPEVGPAYAPPVQATLRAPTRDDEVRYLAELQKSMEQDLEEIKKRLKELSEHVEE